MSNLAERLRTEAEELLGNRQRKTMRLAADEIERLTEIKDLAIKDSMAEADENEQLQAEIERLETELDKRADEHSDRAVALHKAKAEIERLRTLKHAEYRVSQEAQRQIASLAAAVNTMHKEAIEQEKHIAKLEKVLEHAKHLLAGGDKEAVYHLEKALAALEDK